MSVRFPRMRTAGSPLGYQHSPVPFPRGRRCKGKHSLPHTHLSGGCKQAAGVFQRQARGKTHPQTAKVKRELLQNTDENGTCARAYLLFKPHDFIGVRDAELPDLLHQGGALPDSHLVALAASEEVQVLVLEVWVVQNQVLCEGLKGMETKTGMLGSVTPPRIPAGFRGAAQVPSADGRPPRHLPPPLLSRPRKRGSRTPQSWARAYVLQHPHTVRRAAWPAALTDLSASPGVLRAAVQDVREQLAVEAGGGPLPAQVLIHGDSHREQRRPRRRRRRVSESPARAGPKSCPRTARVPAPGPPRPGPPLPLPLPRGCRACERP